MPKLSHDLALAVEDLSQPNILLLKRIICGMAALLELICNGLLPGNLKNLICAIQRIYQLICDALPGLAE
jgi:hypothetical protein